MSTQKNKLGMNDSKTLSNAINALDKLTKPKKQSLHKALILCNNLDKQENFSLSGALNRLKKQIALNDDYKKVPPALLDEALKFDTILQHVSTSCIDKQRFTVYAVGLAVNKYLKKVA